MFGRATITLGIRPHSSFICIYSSFFKPALAILHSTPWAIKRSQLIFACNFVKNQRILMQLSLINLEMNVTCNSMNATHLT